MVGLAVTAGIEAVAGDFPRRCLERGDRAQVRPGGLAAQPLGVVPGRDQEQGGGVGADPVQGEQAWGTSGDERGDELVEALELPVEELGAPSQLAQRDASGVADDVAGPGPQRRQAADQGSGRVPGEPGAQVIGPGQDQGPGLVDRLDPLGAGAAPVDHQRPDRLDRAVPALRRAAAPGPTGQPGRH